MMIKLAKPRPLPLRLLVAYFERTNSREFANTPLSPDRRSPFFLVIMMLVLWSFLYFGII